MRSQYHHIYDLDRDREDFNDEALQHLKAVKKRNMYRKRGNNGHYRHASASFLDVRENTNGGEANGGDADGIPPGLPSDFDGLVFD
ncbi:hypothetical protein AgCh_023089 [Apium graveolens]